MKTGMAMISWMKGMRGKERDVARRLEMLHFVQTSQTESGVPIRN